MHKVLVHKKEILHNDIKTNNFLKENCSSGVWGVLIYFGKGCSVNCCVTEESKGCEDIKIYTHIAPDHINGHCAQCTSNDVYSKGRCITQINEKLCIPALQS